MAIVERVGVRRKVTLRRGREQDKIYVNEIYSYDFIGIRT